MKFQYNKFTYLQYFFNNYLLWNFEPWTSGIEFLKQRTDWQNISRTVHSQKFVWMIPPRIFLSHLGCLAQWTSVCEKGYVWSFGMLEFTTQADPSSAYRSIIKFLTLKTKKYSLVYESKCFSAWVRLRGSEVMVKRLQKSVQIPRWTGWMVTGVLPVLAAWPYGTHWVLSAF